MWGSLCIEIFEASFHRYMWGVLFMERYKNCLASIDQVFSLYGGNWGLMSLKLWWLTCLERRGNCSI